MIRQLAVVCAVLLPMTAPAAQEASGTPASIVFFSITGPDGARLQRFYADLFGWRRGGTIQYPRFEVPGRVVLGVFKDPAGNRVGLVEMENGKAKVLTIGSGRAAP